MYSIKPAFNNSKHSPVNTGFYKSKDKLHQKLRKIYYQQSLSLNSKPSWKKRFVALFLLLSILSSTVLASPDASRNIAVTFGEVKQDIRFGFASIEPGNFLSKTLPSNTLGFFSKLFGRNQKRVERIVILPSEENGTLSIMQGENVNFTAMGLIGDQVVNGLQFNWTVTETSRRGMTKPLLNGNFYANLPGIYFVDASSQGLHARVTVRVQPNEGYMLQKVLQKNDEEKTAKEINDLNVLRSKGAMVSREISTQNEYDPTIEELRDQENKLKLELNKSRQNEIRANQPNPLHISQITNKQELQFEGVDRGEAEVFFDESKQKFQITSVFPQFGFAEPIAARPIDEDGWGGANWWTADDPENQTGNPPGSSPDAGAGNGNFQLTIPVVALPGRGTDVNLSLNYNSRLWSKSGNAISFDSDKGNPAPGWNLGFGKMIYMGSNGGCMLVDADGTRRSYTGSNNTYSYGSYFSNSFTGHTSDGSFIDYYCYYSSSTYGTYLSGSATLPNGVTISYNSQSIANDQVYPTSISDTQGNYITITYQNNRGPNISTVTDTMGRVVNFNYDSLNRLISVTVPGFNGGAARTAVRLHYTTLNLNYAFAYGITTDTNNSSPYVLDAIYFPGTNTGYWFGDTDSYSSYGMIAKVIEQRGMSWSGTAGEQGTVSQGTMSKQSVYDFPLSPNSSLTDAPTYSNLTETWDGIDTTSAVTNYVVNMNSTPRTITVTQPNGIKSKQYMYNAPGVWNDGLIYQDETIAPDNTILSKSVITWAQGAYNSARPTRSEVTDERNQTTATDFLYGTNYNQLTTKKEYDYDNTLLRETRSTYENNAAYTSRHIFNLIKSNEIYDGSGNRVAKTDYEYDNNAVVNGTTNHNLKATPNVIMHKSTSDPFTTETTTIGGYCAQWQYNYAECNDDVTYIYIGDPGFEVYCPNERYCTNYIEEETISVYDPNSLFRGNITKITGYADAVNLTGTIQEIREYDVTGNLVSHSNSANEAATINFDVSTQYAYPINQTEGATDPNSPHRNTSSALYDFNTGLIKQTTDKNGQTSSVTFDPNNLRPTTSTSSNGSYQLTIYDDAAMSVTEEAHEYGGNLASKSTKFLNGVGQVKREETLGVNNVWDIVETKYTNLGQVWKQSRPYRTGDTPQWTENIYDIQGRVSQVIEADGSTVQAFYNESSRPSVASNLPGQTVRTVDAWGRERWERYDKNSKLVELVEPDPDGNGSVSSTGSLVTNYVVDTMGRLIETQQGNQYRYFKYDSLGQLIRQKLAEQTATLNDAGQFVGAGNPSAVWSEAVWYDNRANLTMKVDARGVKTHYSYQINGVDDPLNRLQSKVYDLSGPLESNLTIHAAPNVTYEYMTTGDKMRIKKIRTSGILTEDFSYDIEGRVTDYSQTVDYRQSYPMTVSYIYDSLDRITDVRYPAQYGMTGSPRKLVHYSFDIASRLTALTVDGQQQAGDIVYDASDRTTSIKIGSTGTNQITELYTYDAQNGLLTNQQAIRNGQALLDLSYDYQRNTSNGNLNGKTGHLTKILDNLNHNKDREYKYDAIGRLTGAKGGINSALWQQTYAYNRFGNRTSVTATGVAADNSAIPRDGWANVTYNSSNNRITTSGFEYDSNGNQTRALAEDGVTWLRFEYDSANRLQIVKKDDGTYQQAFQYGAGNARLMSHDYVANQLTLFANHNGIVSAEYTEFTATVPTWTKGYTYLGDNILSTNSPNGQGGEVVEFSHPDRLGTRLVTNQQAGTSFEQMTLPFGTALDAESSGSTVRRFTSYERSNRTGLDYAINRTYDSKQGRFTQVDPIGMSAVDLRNPQTLNLYSYCANDPINHTDPDGLFFGFLKKFFNWLGKVLKWIALAVAIVVAVVTIVLMPMSAPGWFKFFTILGAIAGAASQAFELLGLKTLATIFGVIGAVASFGKSLLDKTGHFYSFWKAGTKAILGVVKAGANLASKVLSFAGHKLASNILGFVSTVAGTIDGLLEPKKVNGNIVKGKDGNDILKWKNSPWQWFKAVRGTAQAFANLVGVKKVAMILGNFGIPEDVENIFNGFKALAKGYSIKDRDKDGNYVWNGLLLTEAKYGSLTIGLYVASQNAFETGRISFYQTNIGKINSGLNSIIGKIVR